MNDKILVGIKSITAVARESSNLILITLKEGLIIIFQQYKAIWRRFNKYNYFTLTQKDKSQ